MEEDVRKRGILYLQQQKFGKKWKKVWSLVYGDSGCSVSRMELFDHQDAAEQTERKRSKRKSKKVIRLSELVRVVTEKVPGSPQGCGSFLVETTEKSFLFAAEMAELEDWIQTLCETAFPMNQGHKESWMTPSDQDSGMVENSIYCTSSGPKRRRTIPTVINNNFRSQCLQWFAAALAVLKDFHVKVKETATSAKCRLYGAFVLRVDLHAIHLLDPKTGATHFTWPYQYIRKFGLTPSSFTFEAGRKSDSGEGVFELQTKRRDEIFNAVDSAIELQRKEGGSQSPTPRSRPISADDGLYSQVNKVRKPRPRADALLAGIEEMTLDDMSIRDRGRGMSRRPLPTPSSHLEPSLVSDTQRDSPSQSETEPDYEEVDAGAVTTLMPQVPQSPYDNIDMVNGQGCFTGRAVDPDKQSSPRQLKRMLTNPCFDFSEGDTDQMTYM
ncbi:hypothetical protein GJAV_G00043150 [Gymnothorax javanicus]|nr:hypothetical protein GJAV_G00043150 [Gymnothorax javanicus]